VTIAVDTAIIEVGGITTEQGVMASSLEEAVIAKAMIEAASRTIVLAEVSKLGRSCFAGIAPLTNIDVVVTDNEPAGDLFQALSEAKVQVIIARKQ
jgi:DeoR/GlpR family transcriptional regulator of sugar metabolism